MHMQRDFQVFGQHSDNGPQIRNRVFLSHFLDDGDTMLFEIIMQCIDERSG